MKKSSSSRPRGTLLQPSAPPAPPFATPNFHPRDEIHRASGRNPEPDPSSAQALPTLLPLPAHCQEKQWRSSVKSPPQGNKFSLTSFFSVGNFRVICCLLPISLLLVVMLCFDHVFSSNLNRLFPKLEIQATVCLILARVSLDQVACCYLPLPVKFLPIMFIRIKRFYTIYLNHCSCP